MSNHYPSTFLLTHCRLWVLLSSTALLTAGCGDSVDLGVNKESRETESAKLHLVDGSPGCFIPRTGGPRVTDTDTSLWMLSWALSAANLLLAPVYAEPTATSWEALSDDEQMRIEGEVISQGQDWGMLQLVARDISQSGQNGDAPYSAVVQYTSAKTTVDFGSLMLVQSDHYTRLSSGVTVGCDPESQWSFRALPRTVLLGERLIQTADVSCWTNTGAPIESLLVGDLAAEASEWEREKAQQEYTQSAQLMCGAIWVRVLEHRTTNARELRER
jgi:hypothetical protein